MLRRIILSLFWLWQIVFISASFADEMRPGYLELKESSANVFSVLWKVPAKGDKKIALYAKLPPDCKDKTQAHTQFVNGAYIQRWVVACESGLIEQSIAISGLAATNTDVLVRMEFINSTSQSVLLTPSKSSFLVPAQASSSQVIGTYTWLGM
ncbi:MAG: hypothetical protein KAT90_03335 [Gammaproteobacteria bacterium]|nr:hypothetical protein [Gammaproteobacteria bacterium]